VTRPVVLSDRIIEKSNRLLTDGRVRVRLPQLGLVAIVQGDTGVWRVTRQGDRLWCSCPARNMCAHLVALERLWSAADEEPAA
jgi:hypothetical protein